MAALPPPRLHRRRRRRQRCPAPPPDSRPGSPRAVGMPATGSARARPPPSTATRYALDTRCSQLG
ncbi:hypothetical protein BU14_0569s0004 [Porphyra umbilicalis]|uniref:Uncharacterized protein n=1 Tax=Porphyra umbilicalis TaxID=2786 RepID=A0A1X6NRQ5_PORUM|nr:hypothetical protein BU14_0569s0004 [Porphyra umbilicalis]|eukprot:OSX71265.1 hypothetical protein BU14_0569s0004 [Porphyra umbilicalis]